MYCLVTLLLCCFAMNASGEILGQAKAVSAEREGISLRFTTPKPVETQYAKEQRLKRIERDRAAVAAIDVKEQHSPSQIHLTEANEIQNPPIENETSVIHIIESIKNIIQKLSNNIVSKDDFKQLTDNQQNVATYEISALEFITKAIAANNEELLINFNRSSTNIDLLEIISSKIDSVKTFFETGIHELKNMLRPARSSNRKKREALASQFGAKVVCENTAVCTSEESYQELCVMYYGPGCFPPCQMDSCKTFVQESYDCITWTCKIPNVPPKIKDWLLVVITASTVLGTATLIIIGIWMLKRIRRRGRGSHQRLIEDNESTEERATASYGTATNTPQVSFAPTALMSCETRAVEITPALVPYETRHVESPPAPRYVIADDSSEDLNNSPTVVELATFPTLPPHQASARGTREQSRQRMREWKERLQRFSTLSRH